MKYSDISENILNETIAVDYDGRAISLREEIDNALDRTGDKSVVSYGYSFDTEGYIKTFDMRSDNYEYWLIDTPVIDRMLFATKLTSKGESNV
jgi:hypothetical protein